jgi:hypothetical protein
MKPETKQELSEAKTMFDFLNVLVKRYDLKNCALSSTVKMVLINGIGNIIKLINAREK